MSKTFAKEKIDRKESRREARENYTVYRDLDKAGEIAVYYGFSPVVTPQITRDDLQKAKSLLESDNRIKDSECTLSICPEEKISILRHFSDSLSNLSQPAMFYYNGPVTLEGSRKKVPEKHMGLEIIGSTKSVSEAILIKTSFEILKEEGYEDLYVNINSIGDKDSIGKFAKELTSYYRKNIANLPAHCKQLLKKDVFECLDCKNEKCRIIKEDAPKSISFLSESSRQHFKEVLEYLEILDIPYKIHHHLVGNRHFCTQTLFEVRDAREKNADNQPLALGVRYNHLAKRIGYKKELPGIGVRLAFRRVKKDDGPKMKKIEKPKIYFVQLGFDAKLKSLKVVDTLRQAKISIYQALSKDKMTSQLSTAENMKIPYTIIMGQKEAIEDSVIVRDMNTRSQDTVKICELCGYLKRLKILRTL